MPSQDNESVALLFGSTNLTENGVFGHVNCVHSIEGIDPANAFLGYYEVLTGDPLTTWGSS